MAKKGANSLRKPVRGKPFAPGKDPRRGRGPKPGAINEGRELARRVLAEKDAHGVEAATAILRKLASKAQAGDVKEAQLLFYRAWGKPEQPVTGPDGGPHIIHVKRVG